MELPSRVLIHNQLLGLKGSRCTLLNISSHGYYEIKMKFGDSTHRALLPIGETVVIASEAEDTLGELTELER